jgi:DNA adenine methylase
MLNKDKRKNSRFASPLRYPGGKTRLAKFLSNIVEENFSKKEKVILAEPYAGGAGASLSLLFAGKVDKIVINDFDKAIFAFWKIAVFDTDFLINKIKDASITIEEWRKQKKIYKNPLSIMRDLAFATLFLNRTNRSGIIEGGVIGGINQTGVWKIDARFKKDVIIERLKKIKKFKNKIEVKNSDGIKFLKNVERRKKKNNYFIFLDPPYYKKGSSLYLNHYIDEDHQGLLNFLNGSSLKWIMTYDNVDYIQNLYAEFIKEEFTINHSAFKAKQGKEILIYSYNITKILDKKNKLLAPSSTLQP